MAMVVWGGILILLVLGGLLLAGLAVAAVVVIMAREKRMRQRDQAGPTGDAPQAARMPPDDPGES